MTFLFWYGMMSLATVCGYATTLILAVMFNLPLIEYLGDGSTQYTEFGSNLATVFCFVYLAIIIICYNKTPFGRKISAKLQERKRKKQAEKDRKLEEQRNRIRLMELEREKRQDNEIYQKGLQKVERDKMTPKIRALILQRDHYHCRMCGRGAEDGVKLEVDHKIPIAKGGKTEIDNLWTLCFDCNRAKSDKLLDLSDFE